MIKQEDSTIKYKQVIRMAGKVIDMKIEMSKLSDIFENPDVLYNMFIKFHDMNIKHKFSRYRPHPHVNFLKKLIILPSDSYEPKISLFGSITDTCERLDVSMAFIIPTCINIDEFSNTPYDGDGDVYKMINKFLDIYKEQMCRFLIYENMGWLITSKWAIEKFLCDESLTSKEITEYMLFIRDKYFKE